MHSTSAIIAIEKIRLHAYHGVYPIEKREGHTFQVDVYLQTDIGKAIHSDALEDTVDYKQVYDLILDMMKERVHLLEQLASKIAQQILANYLIISEVRIRVSKFHPLSMEKCERTYVELTHSRLETPNEEEIIS